jgi:hypothetical protein
MGGNKIFNGSNHRVRLFNYTWRDCFSLSLEIKNKLISNYPRKTEVFSYLGKHCDEQQIHGDEQHLPHYNEFHVD